MNNKKWEEDAKNITKYYTNKIAGKGESIESLAYRDKKYVKMFFDELFSGIEIKNQSTFLDIGCGMGFLIKYAEEQKIEIKDYLGIDLVKEFIDYSKIKYPDYNFVVGNFISHKFSLNKKYDYVLALGVLVSRVSDYETYLLKFVKKMIIFTKGYVLFNLIVEIDEDSTNYSNRDEIGGITCIRKEKLKEILDFIPNISYKIIEKRLFEDAIDAFIQIKVN